MLETTQTCNTDDVPARQHTLRSPARQAKIEELTRQIESGTYFRSADEIASAMLESGEFDHSDVSPTHFEQTSEAVGA